MSAPLTLAVVMALLLSACGTTPVRKSTPTRHDPGDGGTVMWLGSPGVANPDAHYLHDGYAVSIEVGLRTDGLVVWRYRDGHGPDKARPGGRGGRR